MRTLACLLVVASMGCTSALPVEAPCILDAVAPTSISTVCEAARSPGKLVLTAAPAGWSLRFALDPAAFPQPYVRLPLDDITSLSATSDIKMCSRWTGELVVSRQDATLVVFIDAICPEMRVLGQMVVN